LYLLILCGYEWLKAIVDYLGGVRFKRCICDWIFGIITVDKWFNRKNILEFSARNLGYYSWNASVICFTISETAFYNSIWEVIVP
jgi:hypothetical protein